MTWIIAITAGVLFAAGTYLILQKLLTRIVVGLGLIGHSANLIILGSGDPAADPPIIEEGVRGPYTDPLAQALVLTAIVITFGIMAFLLALAYRTSTEQGSDEVEDDIEDLRIARRGDTP